ncbi:MAG: 4Fe-4S dicluster domain-containing protein [Anaerolineae bacterium]|nr:4Fe-4S dicluster domain-containing protein [Anaerolineae bacterium]
MSNKVINRRDFLRGLVTTGITSLILYPNLSCKGFAFSAPKEIVAKYALIIDLNKCVGCGACADACHIRNKLPEGQSFVKIYRKETDGKEWFLPVQCQHCIIQPCATVCPVNATYTSEEGVVLINEARCTGCKYCLLACPYDARILNEETGTAQKCWLCLDYVLGGGEPACVHACILGARLFGRKDDPESEVAKLIASGEAVQLHPEFGTKPNILYYIPIKWG